MSTSSRTRVAVAVALCLASALITAALLKQWHAVAASSDAQVLARFRGAAFEDVFGFGFWPTWLVFALVQFALAAASWLLLRAQRLRHIVLLLVVVFVVASALEYSAFHREHLLWSGRQ